MIIIILITRIRKCKVMIITVTLAPQVLTPALRTIILKMMTTARTTTTTITKTIVFIKLMRVKIV